jgi:hypothetical protein
MYILHTYDTIALTLGKLRVPHWPGGNMYRHAELPNGQTQFAIALSMHDGGITLRPLSFRIRSFHPGHFVPSYILSPVISSPGHFVP